MNKRTLSLLKTEFNDYIIRRAQAFEVMMQAENEETWRVFEAIRNNLPSLYRKFYTHPICREWRREMIEGVLKSLGGR